MTGGDQVLVPPVLVRDYQRLLRLFPYTYRREHEGELLGHLVESAQPDQSRVAPAERADLLRAVAREWLLSPLGSTASQRRHGTSSVLVLLPLLLALPAANALGRAGAVLAVGGDLPAALARSPLVPAWCLWTVGVVVLALGLLRTAGAVLTVAAVMAWGTMILLCVRGDTHAAFVATGWVVGHTACAVVVAERAQWGRPLHVPPWNRAALLTVAGVVALSMAWLAQVRARVGGHLVLDHTLGMGTILVLLGLATAILLRSGRARQSAPVVLGVVAAVLGGRTGLFGSSLAPLHVVDLGNVLGLLATSVVVMAGGRWVINRMDELRSARVRLSAAALEPKRFSGSTAS